MIVIDSSAVVAILFREPSTDALTACLVADPERIMSTASYLETGIVLARRRTSERLKAIDDLNAFLNATGITLVTVDAAQARLALHARIVYGRGMGTGGSLNFGDAFSYAPAKSFNAPMLFVGNDLSTTDVQSAL